MKSIGVNGDSSVQNAASGRALGRQAVAEGAVADLVVVLVEDDELRGIAIVGWRAEAPLAKRRVLPVVDERAPERLREIGDGSELLVVAVLVAGQQHAQGVMEVVGPLRVVAEAALLARADDLRVVEPRLGDHERATARRVHALGELGHDRRRAGVVDRVDRVEPQPVDVEVAHPALGRLQDPFADGLGVLVVVVDRLAPERRVALGEVRPEGGQRRVPGRADVVVDDVEDDAEPVRVGGVDEPLEAERPAVAGLRGAEVDAVVAPAVAAGELGDRHHLDRRDAELRERGQVLDRGVERALAGERADVQLVDHERGQRVRRKAARRSRRTPADRRRARARAGRRAGGARPDPAARDHRRRAGRRSRRRRARRPSPRGSLRRRDAARAPRRRRRRGRVPRSAPRRETRRARHRGRSRRAGAPRGMALSRATR